MFFSEMGRAISSEKEAADKNLSLKEAFADMAAASKAGAKSTSKMVATKGRTRYAGERSLGYKDAGANAVTLIINAFYASLL